jgi:plasmid stabilization system protein ParE
MDCAVIYSEAALADLEQITKFIAADNAEVAERFANRLVDFAESLQSMPERGRSVKKMAWRPCARARVLFDFLSLQRAATRLRYCVFGIERPISLEL